MQRREFLLGIGAAPLAAQLVTAAPAMQGRGQAPAPAAAPARPRTKIQQSVMSSVWTGLNNSFEERCQILQRIGFKAVDLPNAQQVPILRKYGLAPAIMTVTGTGAPSFQNGIIRKENHATFEQVTRSSIDTFAQLGCPNAITFAGERRGMPYEEAADNAVAYFNRVKGYAEEKGVTLCLEITNSKVVADQRTDQTFNRLGWGIDVCKRVNSPRVKIVYDIYHVQISDGDVVRNLRDNFDHVCHIHVAGVPTRQEIDDTQELNYKFIANAIADLGFTGYTAHEYRPGMGRDVVKSLEQCYAIMDV